MQTRILGKTEAELSVVGFGGIVLTDEGQEKANRIVAQAIDRGVTYFDVAPGYGTAEGFMGPALEPYRSSVFLACKTGQRTRDEATAELHRSLKRLRTDHFDVYQLHGVGTLEEVDTILGPGGALEAFLDAREKGKTRFIGFSAHSEEAALALMDAFDFDTILFPFNWVCWHQGNFGPRVLEKATKKGMGVLALKSLARRVRTKADEGVWPKSWYRPVVNAEEAALALRFTLSRPITAAVSPGHEELLWWACDAADRFRPLSQAEAVEVAARSQGLAPIFPQR